jgi:hypothetical protein
MRFVLVILFGGSLLGCCDDKNAESKKEEKKLEIIFSEFNAGFSYEDLDEIDSLPQSFGFTLNNKDSLNIELLDMKGKSFYKKYTNKELIEEGEYDSSLGVLVKYLYIQHEEPDSSWLEYRLHEYYEPILIKQNFLKPIEIKPYREE